MSDQPRFSPREVKPVVSIAHLEAIDIRVGTIVAVDAIPQADRLMRLRVDFGSFQRTIVAGIKQERADPGALVGVQTLFVVNIPPRKLRGEESHGMLFDLGFADGLTPALALPERPLPNGVSAG